MTVPLQRTQAFWLFIGICSKKSLSLKTVRSIIRWFVSNFWDRQAASFIFYLRVVSFVCFETFKLFYSFSFHHYLFRNCEIFNPLVISFGGRLFPEEQIIPSTASVAVCEQPEPICLSMVPNASDLKSLHRSFVPVFLWIICRYFIYCILFFMIMFDNRLICLSDNT